MPEYPYKKIEEPRKKGWIWILVVLIIAVAGVLVYLSLRKPIVVEELPSIEIEEIKFCSSIDENYNCIKQPNATYNAGDDVWLYIRLVNFSQVKTEQGYVFGITEDIETRDLNGNLLPSLTGENILDLADFGDEEQRYLLLKNKLETSRFMMPSIYTVKITIFDKISGKNTTWLAGFGLE